MSKLCHAVNIENQFGVELSQQAPNRFTVTYGKQVRSGLSYGQAAAEYGKCIMHALACADLLDNREEHEL